MARMKLKVNNQVKFEDIYEEYITIQRLEVSPFTIRSYNNALKNLFLQDEWLPTYKILYKQVREFLSGKGNSHFNKQLSAINKFCKYCVEKGYLDNNPCDGIQFKKHTYKVVAYDKEQIEELLKKPDKKTFRGLRDYTIMLTILDTGIRPNECLQLLPTDIDFKNGVIHIREKYSKTSEYRIVPFGNHVGQAIKKFMYYRLPEWNDKVTVFCTYDGRRFPPDSLQESFTHYVPGITPYNLRHTFALWFIRNGGDAFSLQKIMGHSKLEMTRVYVNLVKADVIKAHSMASPINSLFKQETGKRKL